MTIVLGQQLLKGIIILADSRASVMVNGKFIPWRDNTQKIYRLCDDIFIGLAGDIEYAGYIIGSIINCISINKKLQHLHYFRIKAPKLFKFLYEETKKIIPRDQDPRVEFIIGGMDYSRPEPIKNTDGKIEGYVNVYDKKLFKISSPLFEVEETNLLNSVVAIGSGISAFEALKSEFNKFALHGFSLNAPLGYTALLHGDSLSSEIRKQGIDSVGGMLQIVTIEDSNSGFVPYRSRSLANKDPDAGLDLEIYAKQNGRLTQRNLLTGYEVELLLPHEVVGVKNISTQLFSI